MATNGTTCPKPMKATSNGVFQGENPLDYALPLVILQICIVVVLTRTLAFLLRPLRQPRVIAEIVGGILLGPSALGKSSKFLHTVFPPKSLTVLDTLANLGLLFFLFLVGLELDPKSLRRTGKTALSIALAGITLPFILGIGTSFAFRSTISDGVSNAPFLVFMGVALSITAFPVLARILAEIKLLTTDIGKIALSAAAVNDVAAWILLALAIALSGDGKSPLTSLWVFLSGSGFVIFCIFVVQPAIKWMVKRCPEGEPVKEHYVCCMLAGVLAASFVTDAIGIHALFGAFVIGVIFPKEGNFASSLVEKVEDLVSGLFLPLYFVSSGLKTDVATIRGAQSWGLLVLVIFNACIGKIVGTVVVSIFCKIPVAESMALGFLMNTKGLVELIVLNIGKDRGVLNDQIFAIMVLMAIFTTFITTPLVMAVYKPARALGKGEYRHRTVEKSNESNAQLRLLVCYHSIMNIPTVVNLIEASRGTDRKEGLCVYAMHLMELSERPSAILMVHKARKNGLPFWNKGIFGNSSDVIMVAFEAFRQLSRVSVRPMTAISAMTTIHEDICQSAERKRAAMVIIPFHKHMTIDGTWETTRSEYRWINKRVMEQSPCSVAILVDRGLGGTTRVSSSDFSLVVTVLFFGGSDDREALAFASRMAEHPGVSLTVIWFLPSQDFKPENVKLEITEDPTSPGESTLLDIQAITQLKSKIKQQEEGSVPGSDSDSHPQIVYKERLVKCSEEAVEIIKEHSRSNLFLVGKSMEGPVASGLNVRSDTPELGPVGNLLTSSEVVSTSASVLVVHHYAPGRAPPLTGTSTRIAVVESPEDDA